MVYMKEFSCPPLMVSKETASGAGVTYKNNGYIFITDLS